MLNILSLNCGLAFAPYLSESLSAFLKEGTPVSQVVRQGGSGLIIRSTDRVTIRHQNRQVELGSGELQHYLATLGLRTDCFEIQRTSGEVVLAGIGGTLLISHPQSDLWLDSETVNQLMRVARGQLPAGDPVAGLPDWLSASAGGGQLLISDQRNGRWVLLGSDHIEELERRAAGRSTRGASYPQPQPPTILLKGVTVHLQSAGRLLESLHALGETGEVSAFEEVAPLFSLRVARSMEGIELSDSNSRAGMNAREARKWASILRAELDRLNVRQIERGLIRTVFADGEGGRWVLQWGDEVFVRSECLPRVSASGSDASLVIRREGSLVLLLSLREAACVALSEEEVEGLKKAE